MLEAFSLLPTAYSRVMRLAEMPGWLSLSRRSADFSHTHISPPAAASRKAVPPLVLRAARLAARGNPSLPSSPASASRKAASARTPVYQPRPRPPSRGQMLMPIELLSAPRGRPVTEHNSRPAASPTPRFSTTFLPVASHNLL